MHLHVVAFNVPWPPDYGGIIDAYYRLVALHNAGVHIHLHAFTYGRPPAPELEQLCDHVHYYRRNTSPLLLLKSTPYIVSSRDSDELVRDLDADDYPILLEGLHCTALLRSPLLARQPSRTIIVRAHNIEADYYALLSRSERNPFRRLHLAVESTKIRRYEPTLALASAVLAVSEADRDKLFAIGCRNVVVETSSHPYSTVTSLTGRGTYALYHANLSIPENYRAAQHLISIVPASVSLLIAGHQPPNWLLQLARRHNNVTIVSDPDQETMQKLIQQAQVNILFTHQPTGLKLKLLNSLFSGRHCLVNSHMVAGTPFGPACTIADSNEQLQQSLLRLMQTDFTEQQLQQRIQLLKPHTLPNTIQPLLALFSEQLKNNS